MRIQITPKLAIPESELEFLFTRSGGPGGQNVNKVSTRVEVQFDVLSTPSLDAGEKQAILHVLKSRIDARGILHVAAQESRSQWRNRELAVEKFALLLRKALAPKKKRVKTRATAGSKEKRLRAKKLQSQRKKLRQLDNST